MIPPYQDTGLRPVRHPGRVRHSGQLPNGNETPPTRSLPGHPPDYQPANSYKSARFTDDDDWYTMARKYNVDVAYLINFNFNTNKAQEVNYWLHMLIGCDYATADLTNWKFSGTAKRPWIYIPKDSPNVTVIPPAPPPAIQVPGPKVDGVQQTCNEGKNWFPSLPALLRNPVRAIRKQAVKDAALTFACTFDSNNTDLNSEVGLYADAFRFGVAVGYVLAADGRQAWARQIYDFSFDIRRADEPYNSRVHNWYTRGLGAGIARGHSVAYDADARKKLFEWVDWRIEHNAGDQPTQGMRTEAWSDEENHTAPSSNVTWYYLWAARFFEHRVRLY